MLGLSEYGAARPAGGDLYLGVSRRLNAVACDLALVGELTEIVGRLQR
ncbi:MAG: hypothetical protein JWQ19_2821 [Subtercola sp.]|nr:hypothetical protein [Subtercola sp.]